LAYGARGKKGERGRSEFVRCPGKKEMKGRRKRKTIEHTFQPEADLTAGQGKKEEGGKGAMGVKQEEGKGRGKNYRVDYPSPCIHQYGKRKGNLVDLCARKRKRKGENPT